MKQWEDLSAVDQEEVLATAEAWVRAHRDHVSRLIDSEGSTAFEPSGSDLWHPDRWKAGHWRWWLSLDADRVPPQLKLKVISYERLRSWARNPIARAIDNAVTYRPAPLPTATFAAFLYQAGAVGLHVWSLTEAALYFPVVALTALWFLRGIYNFEVRRERERLVRAVEDKAARVAFSEMLAVLRGVVPPPEAARLPLEAVAGGQTPPQAYDLRAVFHESSRYLRRVVSLLPR